MGRNGQWVGKPLQRLHRCWPRLALSQSLNDIEHFRFVNMCLKAFWFFSAAQFQLRIGTLQEEEWAEFYAVIRF